jgi:hypothetical protein
MTTEKEEIFNILNRVFERPKPFFTSGDVDDILTIRDKFAIGFAEWVLKNYDGVKSITELLEIYKKEKGL